MNRIKVLLLAICLFFVCNVQAQDVECKRFKTGEFIYPQLPGKVSVRKKNKQESYSNGKLEMVWDVKWLSDCEYELTCTKVLEPSLPIKKDDRILATIVSTSDNCFTTEIIYYNAEHPNGVKIPSGEMCRKVNE